MKLDPGNIVVYTVCIVVGLAFAWWITCERLVNAEYKNEWSPELIHDAEKLLTSDYEWRGIDFDEYSRSLCKKYGVDYEGFWLITCSNCDDGAGLINHPEGHYVYQFFSDCTDNPTRLYCGNCFYPAGTDWILKGPDISGTIIHNIRFMDRK